MSIYLEDNPAQITKADLVVGIPSWREEATIALVAEQAALGLKRYNQTSVIINSDNNSDDNTKALFMGANTHGIPAIYLSTPPEIRGKGTNLLQIFSKAAQLEAKAVVVVEADVTSVRPSWITSLLEPILNGHDLTTPLYANPKHQALLTNLALYPLLRCLWGRRVQQPSGGERALSARLVKKLLKKEPWPAAALGAGVDIFITITAISLGLPLCQSYVGNSKVHKQSADATPSSAFSGTMATLFQLMLACPNWQDVRWSRPTAVYGMKQGRQSNTLDHATDLKPLQQRYSAGKAAAWEFFLNFPETAGLLKDARQNDIDHALWANLLLASFKLYRGQPQLLEKIITALETFFWGRLLYFFHQTTQLNSQQIEDFIEKQCSIFEECKACIT